MLMLAFNSKSHNAASIAVGQFIQSFFFSPCNASLHSHTHTHASTCTSCSFKKSLYVACFQVNQQRQKWTFTCPPVVHVSWHHSLSVTHTHLMFASSNPIQLLPGFHTDKGRKKSKVWTWIKRCNIIVFISHYLNTSVSKQIFSIYF